MVEAYLHVSSTIHAALLDHLIPTQFLSEEAAFLYAKPGSDGDPAAFQCVAWDPISADGFVTKSRHFLELSDTARATAIKRAHDLGASLVEFHSHVTARLASFSPSDIAGFEEFVPHVWWRLKGRPYFAVVVTKSSFDGFAWLTSPDTPVCLAGIVVDQTRLFPTALSLRSGGRR